MIFSSTCRKQFKRHWYAAISSLGLLGSGSGALAQEAPTIVVEGTRVTLTATADGSPTPTFAWLKNGAPIDGATDAVLVISAAAASDGAKYTVIASNSAGSAMSPEVELVVQSAPVTDPAIAPVITAQPESVVALAGATAVFSVTATGTPAPTYQWFKNGVAVSGWTSASLSLPALTTNDVAAYHVVVSNEAGRVASAQAQLTLQEPVVVANPPVITSQPVSVVGTAGATASFSVTATGVPSPTFQWLKNGVILAGATNAILDFTALVSSDAGTYHVVVTNSAGSVTSNGAMLSVQGGAVAATVPVFTTQPVSQTVSSGSNVRFSALVEGSPQPTLQWRRNGLPIAGATSSSLKLSSVTSADGGSYTLVATNSAGSTMSREAILTVVTAVKGPPQANPKRANAGVAESVVASAYGIDPADDTSRIVNFSVRASAGAGANRLIAGFVVSEGAPNPVLVRGIGPTLGQFGVADALQDPQISLYTGTSLAAANDDWGTSLDASEIRRRTAQLGTFALDGAAHDAALLPTLRGGAYAVQLTGQAAQSGTAMIEVYDGASSDGGRLINLSARVRVGSGSDVPHLGFVIEGKRPKTVLIRVVGPALRLFGVLDAAADPRVEVFAGASRLHYNDNWNGRLELAQIFAKVGAFSLPDAASKDAALVATLEPGAYTAVVSGVAGSTGTVLVEVYEVE